MARVTGMAKKENLAKIVSDVAAMDRGYNEVKLQKFRKARYEFDREPETTCGMHLSIQLRII